MRQLKAMSVNLSIVDGTYHVRSLYASPLIRKPRYAAQIIMNAVSKTFQIYQIKSALLRDETIKIAHICDIYLKKVRY